MFDPNRPPSTPIPAATVILIRQDPLQVFLLRRHRKSSFMSDTFVFPGGKVDPADGGSAEVAAMRELYEEAGVLFTDPVLAADRREAWRARLLADQATFADLLRDEHTAPARKHLHYWSRWITPSAEPKRFDATFFVAELPAGQTPSFDRKETVDELWISPADALARHAAGEIKLPPPQLRTLSEMTAFPDLAALVAESERRIDKQHPILPRFANVNATFALLLPWDPEYDSLGQGEGVTMPRDHYLATGETRFLLEGTTWRMGTVDHP
jgi:8-oxo-dGTP pyrophosphatase MutT (NUDIX family)